MTTDQATSLSKPREFIVKKAGDERQLIELVVGLFLLNCRAESTRIGCANCSILYLRNFFAQQF
jgi:hypothetical protein